MGDRDRQGLLRGRAASHHRPGGASGDWKGQEGERPAFLLSDGSARQTGVAGPQGLQVPPLCGTGVTTTCTCLHGPEAQEGLGNTDAQEQGGGRGCPQEGERPAWLWTRDGGKGTAASQ